MKAPRADVFTEVVLAVFRLNGALLEAGDRLVQPLGLTSARWQVMGAVALASKPLTVPQIANAMGITRQGVQKQVNALVAEGLLVIHPNPGHKRSPLIAFSEQGKCVYEKMDSLHSNWANRMVEGISGHQLQVTLRTIEIIQDRLVADIDVEE